MRLRLRGIEKSFGATRALGGVDLEAPAGEVLALIGENGAGKSTLMKVISGAHTPDAGTMEIDGRPFAPRSPRESSDAGVAMIYQELTLAPHLTAEENLVLGREPARLGFVSRGRRRELALAALEMVNHPHLPLDVPVRELSVAQQQLVEIARACASGARVVILDEPTSSLGRHDVENLFKVIARLAAQGVALIYISHFLEECRTVAKRYLVLRDGKSVGAGELAQIDDAGIIRLMVGREVTELYPRIPRRLGETVLQTDGLTGARGKPHRVSFSVRRGEIFGFAGLIGAGRTEILRNVFGLDAAAEGVVNVEGKKLLLGAPVRSLAAGLGLLSENRKTEGLLLNRDLADNLTLSRLGALARGGFVSRSKQLASARAIMQRLDVRAKTPTQPVGTLSGGNQQKIAFGRLLHQEADIFLLDEPTRGIDVGAKAVLYRQVLEAAQAGHAVVMVSSYLPELLGMCDTIGVMCRGELVAMRPRDQWDEHSLLSAALGQDTPEEINR
ncbi:MAG TPA: sugar ABC transporter ATP-binding protein [Opitutales bacterium]|nr:sugar ABC transporter ATP-binding protein [Opitutales bacterium]